MCPIGHKSICWHTAFADRRIALELGYVELHRRVVRRVRIVEELVADDDISSSIKNVHFVRGVEEGVGNEVGLDVAQELVHF